MVNGTMKLNVLFQIGPPLGAYFASRPFSSSTLRQLELNIYAAPAALTLVLLLMETAFLSVFLPETKGTGALPELDDLNAAPSEKGQKRAIIVEPKERLRILRVLRVYHFLFLALFSGEGHSTSLMFVAQGSWVGIRRRIYSDIP
jgi:hypothetical protein